MVKPGKKLKKIILIAGIAGAVYGGFKYLLPLVIPFLLAYAAALWLRPSVRFIESRTAFSFRGKKRRIPPGIIGAVELILIAAIIAGAVYFGGKRLFSEAHLFLERLPGWLTGFDVWLTEACRRAEETFGLRDGVLVDMAGEMVKDLAAAVKQSTMPFLMANSMAVLKKSVETVVVVIIFFVATLLSLQEMEEIRERRSRSTFHREFSLLGKRLVSVGSAWLKTQLTIMMITAILCTAGLFLIKNPYYIMFGIGIGVLDALPVFGTGTVLIPWGIILLARQEWGKASVILALYVLCYFLREIMEAKIMADRVGLSSLETLAAMYVGLKLFGIIGFLLGPIGLLMIEDLLDLYWNDGMGKTEARSGTGRRTPG